MPNPETRQFIERMGLAVERMGLTRTFGRLFGLLMVADRPLSLDEIVERLDVSKASVSTNARACEELGLARRVGVRGDRRDYYEIAPRGTPGRGRRALASPRQAYRNVGLLPVHG